MSIKLKFERYSIDTYSNEGKAEYAALVERIKSIGHKKPFNAIGKPSELDFELIQELETDHLFNNQFNTKECRLFDWRELSRYSYGPYSSGNLKQGYFIVEGLKELNKARREQLACGYCGKKYKKSDQQFFCEACLGSEYLTKDDLWMTALVSVIHDSDTASKMRKEILKNNAWNYERIDYLREIARAERLKRKTQKKLEDLKETRKIRDYEIAVQIALLENGIDTENLIFYSHIGEWLLGWREPITEAQKMEFQSAVEKIADKIPADVNGIELLNLMSYKIKREQAV